MKKTLIKSALLVAGLAAVAALTGCGAFSTMNANTPHTTIKGQIVGQPFSIQNPKDTILEGLEVSAGTNGVASIKIQKLSTVMNTANIAATGEAEAKVVQAGANAFEQGLNAAAKVAAALPK